jgi:hypothetical protein
VAEMTDDQQAGFESRMAHAIIRGVLIGLPLAFVVITAGVVFATDRTLGGAAAIAILPSVLLGVFGGGFAGVAKTMD